MKRIQKKSAPRELDRWYRRQPTNARGEKINVQYRDIPPDVHRIVLRSLLREQGWLCCYTGIPLTESGSHIEHLLPRSLCFHGEDIQYKNLLAAYPGPSSAGDVECPFGARVKQDWYDRDHFVHPLKPECENRFFYKLSGEIVPSRASHNDATATIDHLKLDHGQLRDLRRSAIEGFLFLDQEGLSLTQARRIGNRLRERDRNGHFHPYCFVIEHALKQYILIKERQHAKRIAIRNQKKRVM
jgi:uncharacterized protein (TIGR02646 family)